MSAVDRRQLGLLHLYPAVAGLDDNQRRKILVAFTGQNTSRGISQEQFEIVMAELERILWARVDEQAIPDPRLCVVCRRPMRRLTGTGSFGECPEGCGSRAVVAWSRDYWQRRVIGDGRANSRHVWKLRRYWDLLADYLPADRRNERYLAALICKGTHAQRLISDLMDGQSIAWDRLSPHECSIGIEALKDRLAHLAL